MVRLVWERLFLANILKRNCIDVLFTPYQVNIAMGRSVKQVLMLRNMEPFLFDRYPYGRNTGLRNRVLRRLSGPSLKKADRVIAVSDFVKKYAIDKLKVRSERLVTIYHGRDESFSQKGGEENDRAELAKLGIKGGFILTCGSLFPYRRCEDVIAAFAKFKKDTGLPYSLVIAGTGNDWKYMELLIRAIRESGCAGDILMAGHVPHDTMVKLYRYCRVCVIASEIEACPNIAIEAMTAGCCIVSGDSPPLPEMFAGCSLEFRHGNINELSGCLGRAEQDGPLRKVLSQKAHARAGFFSWEKCAQETYDALVNW